MSKSGDISDLPGNLAKMSKSADISDLPGNLAKISKSGDISELPGNLAKMSRSRDISDIPGNLAKMSKSGNISSIPGNLSKIPQSDDISDLPGNLAKMSVSAPKLEKNYTLDLTVKYIKCCFCSYAISYSKNALICCCSRHWYCSTQCRDQFMDQICTPEEIIPDCNTLNKFYDMIDRYYDMETLNMIKEYIRSKKGVSRKNMKKLAEAGDWKAALVIGLTYELRFVCDWDICELALRPPFVKSWPFSHRKAIKYFNMAAEENSVVVFASLGRALYGQREHGQASKDYFMMSSDRFRVSLDFLKYVSFYELANATALIKRTYRKGIQCMVTISGISGFILSKMNLLKGTQSSMLTELLSFPQLSAVHNLLRACDMEPRLVCIANHHFQIQSVQLHRPVLNSIFIQKVDRIDPGVRMDAKAAFDQGYKQRLHHDQPMYLCEHDVESIGNTCALCYQLAGERILSVYGNSFLQSKDETFLGRFNSVVFTLECGLKVKVAKSLIGVKYQFW